MNGSSISGTSTTMNHNFRPNANKIANIGKVNNSRDETYARAFKGGGGEIAGISSDPSTMRAF